MVDPREMQAGPELDAAIAEEIFGYQITSRRRGLGIWPPHVATAVRVPAFSTDPAASAELRAKLWEMGFDSLEMDWYRSRVKAGENIANFTIGSRSIPRWIAVTATAVFTDDPRPAEFLAVAKCALEAVQKRKGAEK